MKPAIATPKIDINPYDWAEVSRILRTHVPQYEVWAFGSRVKWTAKAYSDLDLAIITERPLPLSSYANLKEAFDESSLSIKVDIVDWSATSETFRNIIKNERIIVHEAQAALVDWSFKRLIDCTRDGNLSYGIVQPGQQTADGIPIIRVNNFNDGQLRLDEVMRVSPEIESKYKRTRLEGGEVLLTLVGSTGQSAVAPKKIAGWNIARAVAVIRPDPDIGANWINICLQTKEIRQFLDERANTTVQKTLNLGDVKEIPIPLPPKHIKDGIESIAMALSNKIVLLQETNSTLEAIAQALFKSWFVDFDPVRAKVEGREPEGVPPEIAELFPSEFEDSELGEIPKGWIAKNIGAIAEVVKGKSYSSSDLVENSTTALVSLKSFSRGGGFRLDGFKSYGGKYKPEQVVRAGDLIVAYTDVTQNADVIGKPAIVISVERYETLVASLDVGIVRPKENQATIEYLYGLFCTLDFQAHTYAHTSGTTVLHLSKDAIQSYVAAVPPFSIIDAFDKLAMPFRLKAQENIISIQQLESLRETLLPRLMSGQLRPAEAVA